VDLLDHEQLDGSLFDIEAPHIDEARFRGWEVEGE